MVKDVSTIFSSESSDKQQLDYLKISKNLILRDVGSLRSNFQFNENQDPSQPNPIPNLKESFCHTFYRILGLPVISSDNTRFYNPGFYGNEISQIEIERRNAIDNSQDQNLFNLETKREFLCYVNSLNFENVSYKYQYRFDMMKQPISIDLLDDNKTAFEYDQQIDPVDKRDKYKPALKILRPFKCMPSLTNNVIPAVNMVCAPFVNESNSQIRDVSLPKPYLEFVARIRLSKDISANTEDNKLSQSLSQKLKTFDSTTLSEFTSSVKDLSILELYIVEQLLISLIDVCNKANKEKKNAQQLISKMESRLDNEKITFTNDGVVFDTLERWIQEREEKIASKELLLSQIPGFEIPGVGQIKNKIRCTLTNSFIEFIQADLINLKKELDELNNEKKKRIKVFNSTNSELFYILGEVNGFGIIDALALMLSFWLISAEELVSMFDNESFDRLFRDSSLHSDTVEERAKQDSPLISISEVMQSFDKNVSLILKLANAIIESDKN
jgi:hypothetical protein